MQPRTLLILLALVAVVGAFIFFYEKDLPSTDERRELDEKVLGLEQDDVEAVVIVRGGAGGEKVRLEREPPPADAKSDEDEEAADGDAAAPERGWRLTEPLAARADRLAVDTLVSTLAGLTRERELEEVDRDAFGLDDPEATVTVVTDEGETELRVGAELPASSDRVVAVRGPKKGSATAYYQVRGSFLSELQKELGEWRDKKVFTAVRDDVERLTLTDGDQQVVLAKDGDQFVIESPLADRADADQVQQLLTTLTGLEVRSFLEGSPLSDEAMGLAPPRQTLAVAVEGRDEPFRLELGDFVSGGAELGEGGDGARYARADGQLFELASDLDEAFTRPPAAWRSHAWSGLQVFQVESAVFKDPAAETEVERDGSDWKRDGERIDYSTASDLLYAVADAKAEEVVERAAAEARGHRLAQPLIEVQLAGKERSEELTLYPLVDGLAAATVAGRDAVLLLAPGSVEEIQRKLEDVRNAPVLTNDDVATAPEES